MIAHTMWYLMKCNSKLLKIVIGHDLRRSLTLSFSHINLLCCFYFIACPMSLTIKKNDEEEKKWNFYATESETLRNVYTIDSFRMMGRKTRFHPSIDWYWLHMYTVDIFLTHSLFLGHKFPFIDWFCVFMFHHVALCYRYGNNFPLFILMHLQWCVAYSLSHMATFCT